MLMTRLKTLLSALGLVITLGGCAVATGPSFKAIEAPEASIGQVYIYRPARFFGGFMNHKVIFWPAGKELNLPNGTYYRILVPVGTHSISIRQQIGSDCGSLPFSVAAGETVFIENWAYVASSVGVINTTACRMKIQDREAALKALAETKLIDEVK
jgi:hypothetical protein